MMPNPNRIHRFVWMGLLGVVLGLLVLYSKGRFLVDPTCYHEDAAVQNYWRVQMHDPEAFPDDPLADYSGAYREIGVEAIYYLTGFFVDPVTTSKWLWILYLPIGAYFLFRLGEMRAGPAAGFLTGALTTIGAWNKIAVDDPGSGADFIFPILAGATWALADSRFVLLGVFVLLAGALHPGLSAILLIAIPLALLRLERWCGLARLGLARASWLAACLVACFLWNLRSVFSRKANRFGDFVSHADVLTLPEFGPGGIEPLRFDGVSDWLTSYQAGLVPNGPAVAVLFGLALAAVVWHRSCVRYVERAVWAQFAAGAVLYGIASACLIAFYMPARYLFQPSVLLLSSLVAMCIARTSARFARQWVRTTILFAPLVLLLALCGSSIRVMHSRAPDTPLYAYLRTLPKDALIAAPPGMANHIPVMAHRSVLVASEMSKPYYSDYYAEVSRRTLDLIAAMYARDAAEIRAFCNRYGVTHIVGSDFYYSREFLKRSRLYFDPFDATWRRLAAYSLDAYLMRLPDSEKAFSYEFRITAPIETNFHWNGAEPLPPGTPENGAAIRPRRYEMFVVSCESIPPDEPREEPADETPPPADRIE